MPDEQLKPISLVYSWAMAVVLALVVGVLVIVVGPALQAVFGLSPTHCLIAVAAFFFVFQIILTLVLYRREGRPFQARPMAERFRFRGIYGRDWIYLPLAVVINVGAYEGLRFTSGFAISYFPSWWAAPYGDSAAPNHSGDYVLLVLLFITILLNVFAEELFWRGLILPRQELRHGKHAWWIHGFQFWFFHLFRPWEFAMLLPGMLAYGWVASKTRSIAPGIVIHLSVNGMSVIFLAIQVFS